MPLPKVKEAVTSLGQAYQRVAQSLRWRGNRKLTLSRHTARWLGSVRPRGGTASCSMRCPGRGFGGARVDEVTRNTHSPEEVSGRGEAPQGRPDRRHDQRVRAHQRRSRARHQDRAGSLRDSRSRSFRLSDLRQGGDAAARQPQALGRRPERPARRRQSGSRRGLRGDEEGRAARRARPRDTPALVDPGCQALCSRRRPRRFVPATHVSTEGVSGGHNRAWGGLASLPQVRSSPFARSAFDAMSTPVEITWLLAAVTKGDAVAFERLYGATCAKLYGVVLRILRRHDLAADVMEEAYLQIWRGAGEFDPAHSTPLAWMVAIARRLAIDMARGPQPAAGDSEPEIIDEDEGPGSVPRHQLTDDLKRLLTCIGRLEPDRQRMLLLAYYGAFSREQLAAKLDMPVDLLRASLRRSLLEIEQCLKS